MTLSELELGNKWLLNILFYGWITRFTLHQSF